MSDLINEFRNVSNGVSIPDVNATPPEPTPLPITPNAASPLGGVTELSEPEPLVPPTPNEPSPSEILEQVEQSNQNTQELIRTLGQDALREQQEIAARGAQRTPTDLFPRYNYGETDSVELRDYSVGSAVEQDMSAAVGKGFGWGGAAGLTRQPTSVAPLATGNPFIDTLNAAEFRLRADTGGLGYLGRDSVTETRFNPANWEWGAQGSGVLSPVFWAFNQVQGSIMGAAKDLGAFAAGNWEAGQAFLNTEGTTGDRMAAAADAMLEVHEVNNPLWTQAVRDGRYMDAANPLHLSAADPFLGRDMSFGQDEASDAYNSDVEVVLGGSRGYIPARGFNPFNETVDLALDPLMSEALESGVISENYVNNTKAAVAFGLDMLFDPDGAITSGTRRTLRNSMVTGRRATQRSATLFDALDRNRSLPSPSSLLNSPLTTRDRVGRMLQGEPTSTPSVPTVSSFPTDPLQAVAPVIPDPIYVPTLNELDTNPRVLITPLSTDAAATVQRGINRSTVREGGVIELPSSGVSIEVPGYFQPVPVPLALIPLLKAEDIVDSAPTNTQINTTRVPGNAPTLTDDGSVIPLYARTEVLREEGRASVLPPSGETILMPPVGRQRTSPDVEAGNRFIERRMRRAGISTELESSGEVYLMRSSEQGVDLTEAYLNLSRIDHDAPEYTSRLAVVVSKLADFRTSRTSSLRAQTEVGGFTTPKQGRSVLLDTYNEEILREGISAEVARREAAEAQRATAQAAVSSPSGVTQSDTRSNQARRRAARKAEAQASRPKKLRNLPVSEMNTLRDTVASVATSTADGGKLALYVEPTNLLAATNPFARTTSASVVLDVTPTVSKVTGQNGWTQGIDPRTLRTVYDDKVPNTYEAQIHLQLVAQLTDTPVATVDVGAGVKLLTTDDGVVYVPESTGRAADTYSANVTGSTDKVELEVLPSGALSNGNDVVVTLPEVNSKGKSEKRALALRDENTGKLKRNTQNEVITVTPTPKMLRDVSVNRQSAEVFVEDVAQTANRREQWGHSGVNPSDPPPSNTLEAKLAPDEVVRPFEKVKRETQPTRVSTEQEVVPTVTWDDFDDPMLVDYKTVTQRRRADAARARIKAKQLADTPEQKVVDTPEPTTDVYTSELKQTAVDAPVSTPQQLPTQAEISVRPGGFRPRGEKFPTSTQTRKGIQTIFIGKKGKPRLTFDSPNTYAELVVVNNLLEMRLEKSNGKLVVEYYNAQLGSQSSGMFTISELPKEAYRTVALDPDGVIRLTEANGNQLRVQVPNVRELSPGQITDDLTPNRISDVMHGIFGNLKKTTYDAVADSVRTTYARRKPIYDGRRQAVAEALAREQEQFDSFVRNLERKKNEAAKYVTLDASVVEVVDTVSTRILDDVFSLAEGAKLFEPANPFRVPEGATLFEPSNPFNVPDGELFEPRNPFALTEGELFEPSNLFRAPEGELFEPRNPFSLARGVVLFEPANPFSIPEGAELFEAVKSTPKGTVSTDMVLAARRVVDNPWDLPTELVNVAQQILDVDLARNTVKGYLPGTRSVLALPEYNPFRLTTNNKRRLFETNRVGVEVSPTTKVPIRLSGRFITLDDTFTPPKKRTTTFGVPKTESPFDGSLIKKHTDHKLSPRKAEARNRLLTQHINGERLDRLKVNPFTVEDDIKLYDSRVDDFVPAEKLPPSVVSDVLEVDSRALNGVPDVLEGVAREVLEDTALTHKSVTDLIPDGKLSINDFSKLLYSASVFDIAVPASVGVAVGVPRTALDIHRVASLVPRYKSGKRVPLLPPTRAQVAEYLERTGKPHPFASHAVANTYPLSGSGKRVKSIVERLNELDADDGLGRMLLDPTQATTLTDDFISKLESKAVGDDTWLDAKKADVLESIRRDMVGDSSLSVSELQEKVAANLEGVTDTAERTALIDLVEEHRQAIKPDTQETPLIPESYAESVSTVSQNNELLAHLREQLGQVDNALNDLIQSRKGKKGRKPKAYTERLLELETARDDLAGRISSLTDETVASAVDAAATLEDVHYGAIREALRSEVTASIEDGTRQLDNMYSSLEDIQGGCL
jgi:hypothetical protein